MMAQACLQFEETASLNKISNSATEEIHVWNIVKLMRFSN